MTVHVSHQDIRARLMNPPVKITREAFEAEKAKREALHRTFKIIEASAAAKQARIEYLEQVLQGRDDTIAALSRQIEDLTDLGKAPVSYGSRPIKAIVRDVMEKWPGITWKQIVGPRRAGHIVGARHSCIEAVCRERPDLSIVAVSRIFRKDHSSILYVINKAQLRGAKERA